MASFNVTAYEKAIRKGARHQLQAVVERGGAPGVELRPLLQEGHAASEISGAAQASDADLIVLSTHGLGGWRHLVFGSVAEHVIRLSHCPVLVARTKARRKVMQIPRKRLLSICAASNDNYPDR